MHQHRHLFERICTLENLIAAGKAALRGKRMRPPGAFFLAEFEKEIFALHEELWAGTYRHGGYTYFTIHEPKERLVAAAPFRDRVVHHAIVRVIEPIFEQRFIEDSFACRRGKGGHAAMRRAAEFARRWPYALKCDVRKYFPSIDHEVLMRLLQRVIADERLLGLLRHILDTHADGQRQQWTPGGDLFDVRTLEAGPAHRQPHQPVLRQRLPQPARSFCEARIAGEGLPALYGRFPAVRRMTGPRCGGKGERCARSWPNCGWRFTRTSTA